MIAGSQTDKVLFQSLYEWNPLRDLKINGVIHHVTYDVYEGLFSQKVLVRLLIRYVDGIYLFMMRSNRENTVISDFLI